MTRLAGLHWFKSSYSDNNGGSCVEVAADLVGSHGLVPVRDSKCVAGPVLAVTSSAFAGFVAGVKSGAFPA
ncbi:MULTISPECIES: DUF397 domain-containing protein [Streptomyces]|uniref:DUF397 domain-containing protein n=1 Tax=Streptomyces evansiae TaxID=3075535 RepID=A0ABD5E6G2_9ACTN|nr:MULTISPECIES: DUF397 domain-containing protein [unclassified Streptomyces]ASY32912.1 DUF397 domain-containing protein [Streptomyces sp. CLI2509]MDT0416591.1 DUF397 domain-containing protein [Streptomyces sp. DSM 41982]MYX21074.1 DUF397 domain-containing protein [Streptomyces sp. SID8380]SCE19310.1 protein of unknown function [Streptomyces sp. SolWspMP-sol7th]